MTRVMELMGSRGKSMECRGEPLGCNPTSQRSCLAIAEPLNPPFGIMEAMKLKTIQKTMQISGALTDEAVRNGSTKKIKKRGNVGEPSKDNRV
ncbi:hypothetical protein Tco_1384544 [Tanacetum coccineum]